jgi:hypothetical protein
MRAQVMAVFRQLLYEFVKRRVSVKISGQEE